MMQVVIHAGEVGEVGMASAAYEFVQHIVRGRRGGSNVVPGW